MAKIKEIKAREILDSRGNPTVEVELRTDTGIMTRAGVPSGASTGTHEALELRDGDNSRYLGKGVLKAIKNVKEHLAPELIGMDVTDFQAIDDKMLRLDATENKSQFGANAILGISMAATKAGAIASEKELFQFLGGKAANTLPTPLMNILNGGAHADNGLDVQEFMIVPVMESSFSDALRAGSEIFHNLKKILSTKKLSTGVGDEGGFAPVLKSNEEALELISSAVEKAGYRLGEDILFALDVASTELYKDGKYQWEAKQISSEELSEVYANWSNKYPLVSIEDGFDEDDWSAWSKFTKAHGHKLQLVGDDLFVTNPKRIQRGIDESAANALLVKVNQIGSISETWNAVKMCHEAGFNTVMSHRSGETEDAMIADLAVGMMSSQIKTGSLCRGERTAKYNQLLRIEEILGADAKYTAGKAFRK